MKGQSKKAAQLIAGQIVHDITTNQLERLPSEADLLRQYSVSRPTLREALRILEMYGVIWLRPGPGGGARIDPIASSQFASASSLYFHLMGLTLRDLLNTRLQLEPLMVKLACERVRSGIPWDGNWSRRPRAARSSHSSGTEEEDFHVAVARFAGDPILLLFADALSRIRSDGDGRVPPDIAKALTVTHADVEAAIIAGHTNKAQELIRAHTGEYLDLLEKKYPYVLEGVVEWS